MKFAEHTVYISIILQYNQVLEYEIKTNYHLAPSKMKFRHHVTYL